ncbi:LssY C-terminal domain-containing protein [Agromyces sp. GXQ0307]|uniref:LssY C-terminal domain-containing protein n=1 Tax=Agromyces sp. GXQ0307 TaxID=3377835 RepID=UPI00383BB892
MRAAGSALHDSVDERPAPELPARTSFRSLLDGFFFVFAGLAAVWLSWLLLTETFGFGWAGIVFFVAFWVVLAYLVLPRLHRILTTIYVPDYFIGRTRTSDGLLGDPVNLAFDGTEAALHEAMSAAGWTRADEVTLATSLRIVRSTICRRSYDEAPVSPLFLFGRMQDFAYQQEVAGNPAKRHHVRFWRTPDGWLLPGGTRVGWLAAGTFDRSVGFSLFTLQVTHKIDADIDVERDHIVSTLVAADPTVRVDVLRDFSTGYHSRNGGGDTIRTDGDLPVVVVGGGSSVSDSARATRSDPAGSPLPRPASASAPAPVEVPKRTAFESPLRLAERRPVPERMARPSATSFGAVVVVLRALAGVVWLVSLAAQWNDVLADAGFDPTASADAAAASQGARIFALVALGVVIAVQVLLAVRIWFGGNLSRIVVMVISTANISVAALDSFTGDVEITIRTTLVTVALDILVLLALSSRAARDFARQPRRRRTRRGGAEGADGRVSAGADARA